jgi:hypothetical protein
LVIPVPPFAGVRALVSEREPKDAVVEKRLVEVAVVE